MKIAMLTLGYTKRGGIGRSIAELAERYSKGHALHVFANWVETPLPEGAQYHHVPAIRQSLCALTATYTPLSTLAVQRQRFDIVHNHWTDCLVQDVYTAQSCHRAYFDRIERFKGLRSVVDPTHRLIMAIEAYVYKKRRYKRIISVSEGVKREIIRYYNVPAGDITVIPNGVDLNAFRPDPAAKVGVRASLGMSESDFVVLFVAHEFKRKGLEHIIKAVGLLEDERIKVLVAGRDDKRPYEKLAKDCKVAGQVVFLGESGRVEDYYKAADVFVFPTAYEAFSLATVEAMAAGLPLLATKVNGTEELIRHGKNGFFVSTEPRDIAGRIGELAENRSLLKRMGGAARKTAERYSWDIIAERTMDVYSGVLEGKKP